MKFSFSLPDTSSTWIQLMRSGLTQAMVDHGHQWTETAPGAELVFQGLDIGRPRPFRRQAQATFLVGLAEGPRPDDNPLVPTYPILVRSLSNLLIYGGFDAEGMPFAYMVTPELGCYAIDFLTDTGAWFEAIYERLAPLATSHLVIDNRFDEDLPPSLAQGNAVTDEMREAARVLDSWHLFPAPYPIADLLPPEDYRHLRLVFGVGGLSYGNLSARQDAHRFWMSASGVNKGKIGTVSRDILLVKDYDPMENAIRISVSPGSQPLRVSVDAIEHWEVYQRHPEIGAMIHIHAWVDGISSTAVNYPCGTVEMGYAMSDLLDQDPHPERTIIGLRNHGITATGPNFPDILERLEGRVRVQVPMA